MLDKVWLSDLEWRIKGLLWIVSFHFQHLADRTRRVSFVEKVLIKKSKHKHSRKHQTLHHVRRVGRWCGSSSFGSVWNFPLPLLQIVLGHSVSTWGYAQTSSGLMACGQKSCAISCGVEESTLVYITCRLAQRSAGTAATRVLPRIPLAEVLHTSPCRP